MDKDYLLLKRAALSRLSGEWNDDDFEVLGNKAFEKESTKNDAAGRYAKETLPTLHKHLQAAESLQPTTTGRHTR
jgi:hypothetical protein